MASEPFKASPRLVTAVIRLVIEETRQDLLRGANGGTDPTDLSAEGLAARARDRIQRLGAPRPERVINATGVLIHTNLGRSPLSESAVEHVANVAAGYSDLEFNLEEGGRGSRHDHVVELLRLLTGAEGALVLNNNAAAVLLALGAMAKDREVVISRGELVEIGGSFRIPEILEQSGARLREVGTTNRTHLRDYEKAIGPKTGLLLRVHASNYRIDGFTSQVSLGDLVSLGKKHGVRVLVDLGSGAFLDVGPAGISPEPLVADVVAEGPDVVTLSGDKLLGGPQAGIAIGKKDAIACLRSYPLARAVRVDKLLLAALHATLAAYLDEERARREIPVLRMLFEGSKTVRARAESLAQSLRQAFSDPAPQVIVEDATAAVGGGTLPLEELPTSVVVLDPQPHMSAARLERALRHVRPALLGRVQEERVLLDLRTVAVDEEGHIPGLVIKAWTTAMEEGG
jgi:L-seryl-tRNA(Ser) seleniumtransferase